MGMGDNNGPQKIAGVNINESAEGVPLIVAIGTVDVQQQVLWIDGFSARKISSKGSGGKGGGKSGQYDYSANVLVAIGDGPALGIGDVWTPSWLNSPTAVETYTITSGAGLSYTPTNATAFYNDLGPGFQNVFSQLFNDFSAPTSTSLAGTDVAPLIKLAFGSALTTGTYSINPTGNVYNWSASDIGKTVTIPYTYKLTNINRQETDIVPSGKTITVTGTGGGSNVNFDYGVIYTNTGNALTKVTGTPTVTGTYSISGLGGSTATYKFAPGDINAEVTETFGINDPNAISPGQPQSLNYTFINGAMGQPVNAFFTSKYPDAAFAYPGVALGLFTPMELGAGAEIQEIRYERISPDIYGGGIQDCNPVQAIYKVLTNQQWGLGVGNVPFPMSCIDNGAGGTWGSASATGGTRVTSTTTWNWCAAQSYFISPRLDSQDSVSSTVGKWLEAGCIGGFFSENLLKLVPYGDTSAAGNGCTWQAPSNFIVALDDTIFLKTDEGADPVKITRSDPADAWNTVQVTFDNRQQQYEPKTVPESDQAFIDRWGPRIEEPQEYDFIHTITAATFAANLRLKRGLYIRNTYEFTLPYSYSYLEPMDIVTISTTSFFAGGLNNVNLGVTNLPVRIQKIVDNPGKEGLQVTAEDYPFGAHQPVIYNKQLSTFEPVANAYADPGATELVWAEAPSALAQAHGNVTGDTLLFAACGVSQNWGSTNLNIATTIGGDYIDTLTLTEAGRIGQLAAAFPAQATDNFSSGSTLSASWTVNEGAFTVTTIGSPANGVVEISSVGTDSRANAWFNATIFNANQYASANLTSAPTTSGDALGVAVRMSATGESYYGFYLTPTAWFLFKNVAGTITVFPGATGTGSHTATIGDGISLSANGTTVTAAINSSIISTVTDSSLASGQPGIQGFHVFSASNSLDNFQCGNLSGDPDTVNNLLVALVENSPMWEAGTSTDADQYNTLLYVDGEIMAHSALSYTGQNEVSMTGYIRRGLYGTTMRQHQAGGLVMRLDSSVAQYNYPPQWRGTTVYYKAQSVNSFGNMPQNLGSITGTALTIPGLNSGTIDGSTGLLFPQYNTATYQGAYSASVAYLVGNIVGYLGNTYQCIEATTPGTAPTNTTFWFLVSANNAVFLGNWSSATAYQISNTVIDVAGGGGLYYCLVANTNVQPSTNSTDWQSLGNPSSNVFIGTWSSSVHYAVGNIVEYIGSQYVAVSANTNITPVIGSSAWTLLGSNALFTGTWSSSTAYTANMIAVENGNMYQCILANTNQVPPNATYWQLTGPATLDNLLDGSVWIKNVGLESSQSIVVPNSNFQASASIPIPGWGASNATVSYETSSPFAGTQSLKIVATAQFGGVQSIKSWAVTPGQQFFFSCAMKSDGTQIADAGLAFYQANGTFISSVACPAYTTASWAVATTFGAAPALASSMKIFLENGTGAGGVVEFDEPNIQMILTSSNTLVGQGSIATVSDYALSYAATTTTITWSWSAFNVYCPNGTTYTIAASTGTATAHSLPTSGTIQTSVSNAPIEYTGLTASHTYNFTPFVTLNADGTGTVNILWTNASMPTLAQQAQVANGDTSVPCSSSIFVTAATPASGTGGGGGGGGTPTCFSPNTRVKTQRGDVRIDELRPKQDYVLTARGTWKRITYVTTKDWHEEMMDMGNGEYTTPGHHFLDESDAAKPWKPVKEFMQFPRVAYHGTIHNVHVDCDDDGSAADTEHSFTLANGCVVHNFLPTT